MRLARLLILSLPALLLLAFVTAPPAQADSPVKTLYSLSLLGEPKYPTDFKHFDYVNPDAPKGGELKRAAIGSFDSFNPFIVKGHARGRASGLLFDTLMAPLGRRSRTPATACSPSPSSCRTTIPGSPSTSGPRRASRTARR